MSKKIPQWKTNKPLYLTKKDKRYKDHEKQLKKEGFSDTEHWNLDTVICQFTLPRLKAFRKNLISYPSGLKMKEWKQILDKIIAAFEYVSYDDDLDHMKEINEGVELFGKYFRNLWS